jgi:hypothetical protein
MTTITSLNLYPSKINKHIYPYISMCTNLKNTKNQSSIF